MLVMIVGHLEEAAAVRRRVKLAGLEVRTDWVKESAAKQMVLWVGSVRHAWVVGWPAEWWLGRSALQEESTSSLVVAMVVEAGIAHLFIGWTATVDEVQKVVVLLGLIGHGLLLWRLYVLEVGANAPITTGKAATGRTSRVNSAATDH